MLAPTRLSVNLANFWIARKIKKFMRRSCNTSAASSRSRQRTGLLGLFCPIFGWKQQYVAFPLMVPLGMIMGNEIG
jgi:hypothetical protein